ncbi:MAG: hypothetical protein JO291_04895 [Acidimicrobiia bacterium]|nr:hypothetical protein [Acidimicrobiia bacterium]
MRRFRRVGLWFGLLIVAGSLAFGVIPYPASNGSQQWWCSGPLVGGRLQDGELGDHSLLGRIEDDPRNDGCRDEVPPRLTLVLGLVGLGVVLVGSSWLAYIRDPDWEWLGALGT